MNREYGSSVLRLGLGILFIGAGIMKAINPSGPIGMLSGLGFPGATFWGWLLIAVEIIFGLAVLVGFKVKWTTIPLMVVIVVALLMVQLPALGQNAMGFLKDFSILTGLVALMMLGPGQLAVSKE